MSFQASANAREQPPTLSVLALKALHLGENLLSIDLRGVTGPTSERVSNLCGYLQRKQRRSKVQPTVILLLPSLGLSVAEPVLRILQQMVVPNLLHCLTAMVIADW